MDLQSSGAVSQARMRRGLTVSLILLAAPVTVFANAGTPLMWAGMFHLFLGNALIGAFEGYLLARCFKLSPLRCGTIMILANYVSAWAGVWLFKPPLPTWIDFTLESAPFWLGAFVITAFAITLILEWPFVFLATRSVPKRFLRPSLAHLGVQTCSFVILFAWYFSAGRTSALRDWHLTSLYEMDPPQNVEVYCIPLGGGDLFRGGLGGYFSSVAAVANVLGADRVAAIRDGTNYSLVAMNRDVQWLILTNIPGPFALDARYRDGHGLSSTHMNIGYPAEFPGHTNEWKSLTGFWAAGGVGFENTRSAARLNFALETPFVSLRARNTIALPNGQVILQLGKDQIYLLDPSTKKVALLIRGSGPAARLLPLN